MKNIVSLTFLMFPFYVFAQSFDLRFNLSKVDCDNLNVCYDIQVKALNNEGFNLAGQLYRIFYNNATIDFQSIGSYLSLDDYGNIEIVHDVGPADATAFFTDLGYSSTIGFLNFNIDLTNLSEGGVMIPANGKWVSTTQICFKVDPSVVHNEDVCIEIDWAKDGNTNNLSDNYNEIYQFVGNEQTERVTPTANQTFNNIDPSDGNTSCLNISCPEGRQILPDLIGG